MARIKPYASLFRLSRPSNKLFVGQRGLKLHRCCERTTNWPRTSPWRILPSAKKERIENARWAESVPRPRRPHAIEQTEAFDSVFNSVVLLLRCACLSYIYIQSGHAYSQLSKKSKNNGLFLTEFSQAKLESPKPFHPPLYLHPFCKR